MAEKTPPDLQELLDSARDLDEPSEEQVQQLSNRLAPLLTAASVPPVAAAMKSAAAAKGAAGAAAGATKSLAVKLAWGLAAAGTVGIGVYATLPYFSSEPPAQRAVPSAPTPGTPPPSSAPTLEQPERLANPLQETDAPSPPARGTQQPRAKAAPREIPKTEQSEASVVEEARLLSAATQALRQGQHGKAMQSIRQHARRFPEGKMQEERERIAIEVLVQSDRMRRARERARQFRRSFPNSVQWSRIEQLLRDSQ